ncbi:hypothetical protein K435DRAFT_775896 [Dendrothele bispora CBS 962.96]|uniref:Acetoacetate decarboxylase n=1 Tax=Dendrothele bispora (strain CBS 962.96) TaxID=1314807 RepID=A0A4S8MGT3_DENBC|nr:hypothetical protein K435DRAFT_775896 [Dendrothele bispora CBS 962.96]
MISYSNFEAQTLQVHIDKLPPSMSGVQVAPAPWKLKGHSWSFILPALKKNTSFPSGWAAPFQADVLGSTGEFVGGVGAVILFRYTESPVGPYDELMYLPGKWKYTDGSVCTRITRIYVSSKASTENGRRNWNIPKVTADFSCTQDPQTNIWDLSVRPANSDPSTPPFFHITVHPIFILSSVRIPVSIKSNDGFIANFIRLSQPPLPQGESPEEVATDRWSRLVPGATGKMSLVRAVFHIGEDEKTVGDGKSFPAVVPWSIGTCLEDVALDFGVPELFDGY